MVFETVICARYIGVDILSNILWNSHIGRVVGNANRSLGYIHSSIKSKSENIRESAYNAIVRHQLEYAFAVAYGTRIPKNISVKLRWSSEGMLAGIDNRASITELLKKLEWRTLEQRRADARLWCRPQQTIISIHFPLAIVQWNALTESLVCLQSFDAFKAAICKLQHSRP